MNTTYFQGLTIKINQIINFINSKSDEELGIIFSSNKYTNIQVDLNVYGLQVKNRFRIIQEKNKYLEQIILTFDDLEKEYFYTISLSVQEDMRTNLRTLGHYITELNDILPGDGGIIDLFNIDLCFINSYESFINFARITKVSLHTLNEKITNELNPSFLDKNDKVDQLISDLNIYKGEVSSRKTKEIYKKKYQDYKKNVEVYELYIMLLVCLSVTLVLGQLFAHNFFDSLNISNAVMIKLTILALIATLFTYCFKQISFYRKISEQAHQTYMELEALPEFLTHLPEDKQHEIRADLAKCYFGQNLFDSIKEDSASILEHAKANTEVLKSTSALLDVIKKQNSQT